MRWPRVFTHRRLGPEPHVFDHGCLAAFLIAMALIAALLVAAVLLGEAGRAPDGPPAPVPQNAAALGRCRTMGPASGSDPVCRSAWDEARRAFFQGAEVSP